MTGICASNSIIWRIDAFSMVSALWRTSTSSLVYRVLRLSDIPSHFHKRLLYEVSSKFSSLYKLYRWKSAIENLFVCASFFVSFEVHTCHFSCTDPPTPF